MTRMNLKIEGMACNMCEAHICDVIRRTVPQAKKVTASHKTGEASFLSETAVDENTLRKAIAETGYTLVSVSGEPYEKKHFWER